MRKIISLIIIAAMAALSCTSGFASYSDAKAADSLLMIQSSEASLAVTQIDYDDYSEVYSSAEGSSTASTFNRLTYATLQSTDDGRVLALSGSGTNNDESATPKFGKAQDWSGYNYLNIRIRNVSDTASRFLFYATVKGTDAAAKVGYWTTSTLNVSENNWHTLTIRLKDDFRFVYNSNTPTIYDSMSHLEALRFDYIKGSVHLDRMWLSKNNPSADDMKIIKTRWKKSLVGDESNNVSLPHVASYINTINTKCRYSLITMNSTDDVSRPPWRTGLVSTADLTHQFTQIDAMATAYAMKGSNYYKDRTVLAKIKYALEWMYEYGYGFDEINNTGWRDTGLHDWFDWQIASPRLLINTLILLEDELDAEFIKKEVAVIEHFAPQAIDYGSNLINFAKIMIGSAALTQNSMRLQSAITALKPEFTYDTEQFGQGFHQDGTYLYHTRHFQNGAYGSGHFSLLPEIASFVKDTSYGFGLDLVSNLYEFYRNSFEPLIYDNTMISMANGRSPAGSTYTVENIMKASVNFITLFDGRTDEYKDECDSIKTTLKKYYSDSDNLGRLPIELSSIAYGIVNDEDVKNAEKYRITKVFTDGDKAVHHSDNFMTAISMSSSRIYNYECINADNMRGWYIGDGMQYTYMPGDGQYTSEWWNGADPYKRPGTTVDTQTRKAVAIKQGREYLSSRDFVGGVVLDNTGVVAMDLESYHNEVGGTTTSTGNGADAPLHYCTLTANKAWFMFDDEVVSLGCGINATDGYEVCTIVDNRLMSSDTVTVDGSKVKEGSFLNAGYLNLEDKIGYVFPGGEDITLNVSDSDSDFTEAWISHGVSPANESYAYITLPSKNAQATSDYAKNPDAVVLSNTSSVQAVYDKSSATTGYVFGTAASFGGIRADNACTLITKDNNGLITAAVSDPTHKLASITLTLDNAIAIFDQKDSNVSFEYQNGSTVITVDTSDLSGKSFDFSYCVVPSGADSLEYADMIMVSKASDEAKADFRIVNPTQVSKDMTIILAVYDSMGKKLENVIFEKVTVPSMDIYRDSLTLPASGTYFAKAFVWNSIDGIKSLYVNNSIIK